MDLLTPEQTADRLARAAHAAADALSTSGAEPMSTTLNVTSSMPHRVGVTARSGTLVNVQWIDQNAAALYPDGAAIVRLHEERETGTERREFVIPRAIGPEAVAGVVTLCTFGLLPELDAETRD